MGLVGRPNPERKTKALGDFSGELSEIFSQRKENLIDDRQAKLKLFHLKKRYRLGKLEDIL